MLYALQTGYTPPSAPVSLSGRLGASGRDEELNFKWGAIAGTADGNGCEVLLLLRQVVWSVLVVELFLLYNNHPLLPPDSPQVSRPAALMRQTWKTDIGVYGCVFWLLGRVKEKGRKNAATMDTSRKALMALRAGSRKIGDLKSPILPRFSFLFP